MLLLIFVTDILLPLIFQSDTIPLTAMVLSAVFWPAFREEKLTVAEDVQRYIYSNLFLIFSNKH